jgi:hypothetical protein
LSNRLATTTSEKIINNLAARTCGTNFIDFPPVDLTGVKVGISLRYIQAAYFRYSQAKMVIKHATYPL